MRPCKRVIGHNIVKPREWRLLRSKGTSIHLNVVGFKRPRERAWRTKLEGLLYQYLDHTFGSKLNTIAGNDAEVDAPGSQGNCSDRAGHRDDMEGEIEFRLFRRSSGPIILEKGQVQDGRPKRLPRRSRRTVEGYTGIDSSSDDDNDGDDADTLRKKNAAVKLQSVAVDYETVIANAAQECARLAARSLIQIQAEEEARRKEEERIARLKRERGEAWLPAAQRKFSQGNKQATDTFKRLMGRLSHPITAQSGSVVSGLVATLPSDVVLNSNGAHIIGLGTVVRDWRDGAVEASVGCWEVDADVQTRRRRQILLPRTPKVGTKREGGGCEMVGEQGKKRKKRRKKARANQCDRAAPPRGDAIQFATEKRSMSNQPASHKEIATNVQVSSTGQDGVLETTSPVQVTAMELAEPEGKEEEKKGGENENKKKKKKRRNNEKKKLRKKEKRKEKKKKKKEEKESRDVTKSVGSNARSPVAGISGP